MRATQFTEYGDPSVLELVDVDEPHAGPGEIRIAVRAVGVNAMDWKIRAGQMREMMPLELPAGLGLDAAGTVDEIGDGVGGVGLGDAVFGTGTKTYAERAVLTDWAAKPRWVVVLRSRRVPGGGGDGPADPRPRRCHSRPDGADQRSGPRGRDGRSAVRACPWRAGHRDGQREEPGLPRRARGYADNVWRRLVDRVRDLAPGGVDAALDIAGSGVIPELVELTGDALKVVSIADFTAGDHGAQVSGGGGDRRAALAEAARLFQAGKLRIPVANTFTLDQAPAAHEISQAGHVAGRTVLTID